jgi:hypothetical protein
MRATVGAIAASALVFATAAAAQKSDAGTAAFIDEAKANLTETFKDPQSAQYRSLFISKYGDARVLCGEVNGKNSYGGYVGFRRFAAAATPGPKFIATSAAYAYDQAERMCEGKIADVK